MVHLYHCRRCGRNPSCERCMEPSEHHCMPNRPTPVDLHLRDEEGRAWTTTARQIVGNRSGRNPGSETQGQNMMVREFQPQGHANGSWVITNKDGACARWTAERLRTEQLAPYVTRKSDTLLKHANDEPADRDTPPARYLAE